MALALEQGGQPLAGPFSSRLPACNGGSWKRRPLGSLLGASPLCWTLICDQFHELVIPPAQGRCFTGGRVIPRNLSQPSSPLLFNPRTKHWGKASFLLPEGLSQSASSRGLGHLRSNAFCGAAFRLPTSKDTELSPPAARLRLAGQELCGE